MERRGDALGLKPREEMRTQALRSSTEGVDMAVMRDFSGHEGALYQLLFFESLESRLIGVPDLQSRFCDLLNSIQLNVEDRREDITDHIASAWTDPGVLVDVASHEGTSIRSLFANDLGRCREFTVPQEEQTTLAADHILGLVERITSTIADRAKRATSMGCADPLRGVFKEQETVVIGEFNKGIHVACDARVVDRHDHLGARRDSRSRILGTHIHGQRVDFAEHRSCAPGENRIRLTNEGEGRHQHFITRADAHRDQRHIHRLSRTRGEQRMGRSGLRPEAFFDPLADRTIPADLAIGHGLSHDLGLTRAYGRTREWNTHESPPGIRIPCELRTGCLLLSSAPRTAELSEITRRIRRFEAYGNLLEVTDPGADRARIMFGKHLVDRRILTEAQLLEALDQQQSLTVSFGRLAHQHGFATLDQICEILDAQRTIPMRFGALAIEKGYMTEEQVEAVLATQQETHLPLGQVIVQLGLSDPETLDRELRAYLKETSSHPPT